MMSNIQNKSFSNEFKDMLYSSNQTMKINKGTFLFQEGMPANELYVIQKGWIRESGVSHTGKEISFCIYSVGDIVGEKMLFVNNGKRSSNTVVLEDGEVIVIKKDYFEKKLLQNQNLLNEYMKWLNEEYQETLSKFRDLILFGKKGALYSTIIRLSKKFGEKKDNGDIVCNTPLTIQDLAYFCGTNRETVYRMLHDLRELKVLSMYHGKIIIHDYNHLLNEIT